MTATKRMWAGLLRWCGLLIREGPAPFVPWASDEALLLCIWAKRCRMSVLLKRLRAAGVNARIERECVPAARR